MALSARLEFRQSQSLTLTPQLMQSIRLLQLGHLELNAFVEAELLRNPLLEREEGDGEGAASDEGNEQREMRDEAKPLQSAETLQYSAAELASDFDTPVDNLFPDQSRQEQDVETPTYSGGDRNGSFDAGEAPDLDQYVAARPRLSDHLEAQAQFLLRTPADRLIARYLIDGLNQAGYLAISLETVAETLGAELADVEAVLGVLQTCEPTGIFARDVAECLALQLRERDRLDPIMQRLLANLDLLASHDMPALLRAVGCDREDLADMLAELRQLDPKPGLAFDTEPVEAVVPDVFVRSGPDGAWLIDLNSDILPRVLVNRRYHARVSRQTRDASGKGFLADCLASANWLTKSLDQRAQTIMRVAAEIVRQQDGFLVHGVAHLRPMTLRMVAEAIEMHESTVSRVTANKYMATPRGIFDLKYFFTTAIASADGSAEHSAEAVRHRIRQLIDAEPASAVLSDDTIAEILRKEQGMDVARRTVAKYREAMNIPSSVIRRRQKKELARAG
ncbi:RNA polymerase factor sigma-54 [Devosia sp. PTR5]|uniref:RNA polymerase sigma-54 factor n=1 Tax=Devosia oryzisoli TaxID=2774138 RepID=A0A927FW33_9HYPH|nr:RNA polymerase factor sigma-54 [Devosia oryzisoli]MBD8066387.1 RNA polymerase factor sigma-54 [Devosia oryzisoli]